MVAPADTAGAVMTAGYTDGRGRDIQVGAVVQFHRGQTIQDGRVEAIGPKWVRVRVRGRAGGRLARVRREALWRFDPADYGVTPRRGRR